MSSLIMQQAIPKPTNYISLHKSDKNSSKHYHATCSLQLTHNSSGNHQPSLLDFDTIQSFNSEFKKDINTSWLTPNYVRKTFHGGALKPRRFLASRRCWSLQCSSEKAIKRRSANYKPPSWDFNYIQSLTTQYTEERYSTRAAELIVQVKMLLQQEVEESVRPLELIDDLQRLGISHHFHDEINQILNSVHFKIYDAEQRDLYSTALAFRLLRQHGFRLSQDVFDCFKNNEGDFISVDDTRGVLQLYEASFLLTRGEETLELAKEFATNFLHRKLEEDDDDEIDEHMLASVRYALELPTHWRIQRPNARWFIHAYGKRPQMNPFVLELAKLDFTITQAMHQQELKLISRWWKETKLAEKLPFVRDRLVECYLWTLGIYPPQHGYSRMMATKANIFITIMDDIFDVYATLEELQLFLTAIQRWDLEAMNQLPEYMQLCFLALNNFINEMAYDVMKEQGILIIQHLRKSWRDLFTSFLQEARWHAAGHTPTLNEYLSIGWISSTVPIILSHAYFLITNPVENEVVRSVYEYNDVVRSPSLILRLVNDLATSTYEIERGEVANSVQCYMKESGASREEAREHVELLIWETWKKMNQERVENSEFSKNFITIADDLGRMAQYMYQYGDGHGIQNPQIKERISSLLFEPIL